MHLQLRASRYAGDYILSSHTCCSIIHGKRKVFPLRGAFHPLLLHPSLPPASLSPSSFRHYTRDPKFKLLFCHNAPYTRDIFGCTVLISQIDATPYILMGLFRQDESYPVPIGSIKPQSGPRRDAASIFRFSLAYPRPFSLI